MAESEEELKSLLMRVKEERLKSWPKAQHSKTKIMASGPITSWQVDGEKDGRWDLWSSWMADFIFLDSKITKDHDCSHEIKMFAPWKKSYDKPRQRIKKQRHHFADTEPYSQSYSFSSSHVQCESWTIKKLHGKEIMPSNCGAGEDSWDSLGLQGDQTSQS